MECKIDLIFVPVTDVERAIDCYVNKVGFTLDIQARVDENARFVQVAPPSSLTPRRYVKTPPAWHRRPPGSYGAPQV